MGWCLLERCHRPAQQYFPLRIHRPSLGSAQHHWHQLRHGSPARCRQQRDVGLHRQLRYLSHQRRRHSVGTLQSTASRRRAELHSDSQRATNHHGHPQGFRRPAVARRFIRRIVVDESRHPPMPFLWRCGAWRRVHPSCICLG